MSCQPPASASKINFAIRLYRTAITLLLPIILLGFFLRSLSQKAYRARLWERLGRGPKLRQEGLVIHGASVGEIISLTPFINACLTEFSTHAITLTSFTPTGSEQILKRFGKNVQHCYLPIDAPFCVRAFLKKTRPKAIVIMETELWPSLILEARAAGIKILLINGRLSERSFPRYQKLRALIAPCLQVVDKIHAQSQADQERFIELGASPARCEFGGNLKYDIAIDESLAEQAHRMRTHMLNRKIWVVGSSHQDEEALVFKTLELLRAQVPNSLLILAPRHPERYEAIKKQAEVLGLSIMCRSATANLPGEQDAIWLIDTMGELLLFYAIADVCVVAGSFGETGGHNPIEAAYFAKPIVVGTNTQNFKAATKDLLQAKGLVQLNENSAEQLARRVNELFVQPDAARALGENAFASVAKNRGATRRAIESLQHLLEMH